MILTRYAANDSDPVTPQPEPDLAAPPEESSALWVSAPVCVIITAVLPSDCLALSHYVSPSRYRHRLCAAERLCLQPQTRCRPGNRGCDEAGDSGRLCRVGAREHRESVPRRQPVSPA